jgi:hypothetical protein
VENHIIKKKVKDYLNKYKNKMKTTIENLVPNANQFAKIEKPQIASLYLRRKNINKKNLLNNNQYFTTNTKNKYNKMQNK